MNLNAFLPNSYRDDLELELDLPRWLSTSSRAAPSLEIEYACELAPLCLRLRKASHVMLCGKTEREEWTSSEIGGRGQRREDKEEWSGCGEPRRQLPGRSTYVRKARLAPSTSNLGSTYSLLRWLIERTRKPKDVVDINIRICGLENLLLGEILLRSALTRE